ncbi:MAG TPA: NAD(P)-dependent oxidoreductase [Roseiflexaceae bacterium]|nr:NAD(P)-dependent oxidoreductase [Roseiflexaceae bacterium]
MQVFVAGATGALGIPVLRQLIARGHDVVGMTRSNAKRALIEHLGARAVVADALDARALAQAVREAAPTHVLQLLTALPKNGPMRAADIAATNQLWIEGTANLLQAAIAAGAKRLVGESFVTVYGYGDLGVRPRAEDELPPLPDLDPSLRAVVEALRSLEQQLQHANQQQQIETIILRYGMFYGAESASTRYMVGELRKRRVPLVGGARGLASLIHIEDAAAATVAALERGEPGAIYNIADDEPVDFNEFLAAAAATVGAPRPFALPGWLLRLVAPMLVDTVSARLPISNARACRELEWRPRFPSYREGLRQLAGELGGAGAVTSAVRSS